jgi:hypothetical protein
VKKELFIDLLDPALNLAPTIPEKLEGLAWGPDLPDGRHVLYVTSDNDLNPNLDNGSVKTPTLPATGNLLRQ